MLRKVNFNLKEKPHLKNGVKKLAGSYGEVAQYSVGALRFSL